jgi:hypothetical protein
MRQRNVPNSSSMLSGETLRFFGVPIIVIAVVVATAPAKRTKLLCFCDLLEVDGSCLLDGKIHRLRRQFRRINALPSLVIYTPMLKMTFNLAGD